MANVAAIVLAAGRGRRFGVGEHDSKVLAALDGEALVRRVARTALASSARPVIVVTGHAATLVEDMLRDLDLVLVRNADYAQGMAGSLAAGLAALPPDTHGALVMLGDMPLVAAATLDALVAAFDASESVPDAVVPSFDGRRGNPILLGRAMFADVARLHGDVGARHLLAAADRHVVVRQVDDSGVVLDIDTPDALRALHPR